MSTEVWVMLGIGAFTVFAFFVGWLHRVYRAITEIKEDIVKLVTYQEGAAVSQKKIEDKQNVLSVLVSGLQTKVAVLEERVGKMESVAKGAG